MIIIAILENLKGPTHLSQWEYIYICICEAPFKFSSFAQFRAKAKAFQCFSVRKSFSSFFKFFQVLKRITKRHYAKQRTTQSLKILRQC